MVCAVSQLRHAQQLLSNKLLEAGPLDPAILGSPLRLLTVVFVCMLYCMLGGDATLLTMKCTAPSVDSGFAAIQSSAAARDAIPSTCNVTRHGAHCVSVVAAPFVHCAQLLKAHGCYCSVLLSRLRLRPRRLVLAGDS